MVGGEAVTTEGKVSSSNEVLDDELASNLSESIISSFCRDERLEWGYGDALLIDDAGLRSKLI